MEKFETEALAAWDYGSHSVETARKFLNTEKELQLSILEKWFPLEQRCGKWSLHRQAPVDGEYTITGYADKGNFWSVRLKPEGKDNEIEENPAYIIMPEDFTRREARDGALNKLFGGK